MLKFAIFLLLVLEPLLLLARPQYYCGIPCPLTKSCNSGYCKYPSGNNYGYDEEPYCPYPINLTVNYCSEGGFGESQQKTTTPPPTPPTPPTPPILPAPPPVPPTSSSAQSRTGEDGGYRRGGGGRSGMLTSLFSIPGAVADTFLSGEVTL